MTMTATRPAAVRDRQATRPRRHGRRWPLYTLLAVMSLLTLGPFAAMIVVALSPRGEPTVPAQWPGSLTLDNVVQVLRASGFAEWTLNSLIYSGVSVVIILLTASMAGYAFAKKRFPGATPCCGRSWPP
ncbi:hypothetical protein ACFQQB_10770 [Nonomuraea rubra]|uniref:hypothetical protein n=1 Tax=Nonomuraea rubra TaxID=46180 RepID=UPI00361A7461